MSSAIVTNSTSETKTSNKELMQLLKKFQYYKPQFNKTAFMFSKGKIVAKLSEDKWNKLDETKSEYMEISSDLLCDESGLIARINAYGTPLTSTLQARIIKDNKDLLKQIEHLFADTIANVDLAVCVGVVLAIDTSADISKYIKSLQEKHKFIHLLTSVSRLNPLETEILTNSSSLVTSSNANESRSSSHSV